jgi:hypothetical protein
MASLHAPSDFYIPFDQKSCQEIFDDFVLFWAAELEQVYGSPSSFF